MDECEECDGPNAAELPCGCTLCFRCASDHDHEEDNER